MYRAIRTVLIVGGFVGLLGAGTARAQVTGPMTFTTWFPFTVNGKTVPAGTYSIRPVEEQNEVLQLTSSRGNLGVFFEVDNIMTKADVPAPKSEIVFLHDGDQYLLKDVWVEGQGIGAEAQGKLLEQRRAAALTTPTEVHVAAVFGTVPHAAHS